MRRTWSDLGAILASPRAGPWVLAAAVAVVALRPALDALWDADVWWILRAGELVLDEARVPRTNRFSFTEPGRPWVMHEWLFGVAYAAVVRAVGLPGLALVRVACFLAAAGALAVRAARDARRPLVAALAVALALAVYGGRFGSPRPVGMSYAFAALAACLAFEPAFDRRHALALGAVVAVWANAHGSFPLGVVAAALGVATPGGSRRARVAGLALAALATLATPYGLGLHGLVAGYAGYARGGDGAVALVHARILEWWPLLRDPLRVADPDALALALALAVTWVAALRDPRWRPRAVLCLALGAMALRHNRHLQLYGLLGLPLAAGPLDAWLPGAAGAPRLAAKRALACLAPGALVALVAWALAARARPAGEWVDRGRHDDDFAALVRTLPAGARLYTPLAYTGFAIWTGYPRVRVLYDTRNDCYSEAVLRAGFDVSDGRLAPAAAAALLDRHGVTHALVRRGRRDAALFRALPGSWRAVAARGDVALYARREAATRAPGGPP